MIALILNSGLGHRMGDLTKSHPKCMTEICENETILSRQLKLLLNNGVYNVIVTTGYFDEKLMEYCKSLNLPINICFVKNPLYDKTNYIYSIYCARKYLIDDILLLHGDLVFEDSVINEIINDKNSCMKTSSTLALPDKDFKAMVKDGRIYKIGVNVFDSAVEAQALYKINKKDWLLWLDEISKFCENGNVNVYAEDAFNAISDKCEIYSHDVKERLCTEVDTPEDLKKVKEKLINE